jgi:WD40 repeat protein
MWKIDLKSALILDLELIGSFDASVRVWDIKSQQRHPIQIFQDAKDSITSIIVSGSEFITGSVDGYVRSYDIRMGQMMEDYFEGCSLSFAPFSFFVEENGNQMPSFCLFI